MGVLWRFDSPRLAQLGLSIHCQERCIEIWATVTKDCPRVTFVPDLVEIEGRGDEGFGVSSANLVKTGMRFSKS